MAMCAPTVRATPPMLSNVEHVVLEQTLKVRLEPTVGGPAGDAGVSAPLARAARAGAPYSRERAKSRSQRSNAFAAGPRAVSGRPVGRGEYGADRNGAAAVGVADSSLNGAEAPSTPPV